MVTGIEVAEAVNLRALRATTLVENDRALLGCCASARRADVHHALVVVRLHGLAVGVGGSGGQPSVILPARAMIAAAHSWLGRT